jgi:hypothetical protein
MLNFGNIVCFNDTRLDFYNFAASPLAHPAAVELAV